MPLPTTVPEDPQVIESQRSATTTRFAGMMLMLTILSLAMYWGGRGPADSWTLAVIGPVAAMSLFILSGITKLRRTVQDTSICAAGITLSAFLISVGHAGAEAVALVAGILVGIAALTYTLLRNLDGRIAPAKLLLISLAQFCLLFFLTV